MQSEEGKEYEVLVRESTWDADSECFRESAKVRATLGYYQLVATIDREGGEYDRSSPYTSLLIVRGNLVFE